MTEVGVGLHSPTTGGRRQRWAERENARRQARYAARISAWERVGDYLDDLFRIAHGDPPETVRWPGGNPDVPDPAAPPFVPLRGEQVLCRTPGVWLVDSGRRPGERAPGFGDYSALDAARLADPDVAGAGRTDPHAGPDWVTVTDHRIVVQGARSLEWRLDSLVLVDHAEAEPMTMLHVPGEPVSGLRYPGPDAPMVRFVLAMAIASHNDEGEWFRAALRTDRERHARLPPAAPSAVSPAQAPGAASSVLDRARAVGAGWLGQPRSWRLAEIAGALAVVAVLLLTFGRGSSTELANGTPSQAVPPSTLLTASPTPALSAQPSPTPGGSVSPTAPSPTPSATGTQAGPTPSPTPDLCGAPANPYGYNLCGRGSLVHSWPSDVCSFFTCAADFGDFGGFLVECGDHLLSTSEAPGKGCARHRGVATRVYGP